MKMATTILILTLLALATFALPLASAGTQGTWTGWITVQKCGGKVAKVESKQCLEKCAANGEKLIFYNGADEKLYALDNQDAAKKHLGYEVKVTGELDGKAIKVESIEAAKAM